MRTPQYFSMILALALMTSCEHKNENVIEVDTPVTKEVIDINFVANTIGCSLDYYYMHVYPFQMPESDWKLVENYNGYEIIKKIGPMEVKHLDAFLNIMQSELINSKPAHAN